MLKKIILTGAAGRLGSYLREPLAQMAEILVSSDILPEIGRLYPGESYVCADLSRYEEILDLLEGADMVIHFGAKGDEAPFGEILGPNIVGSYNIWEAAYQNKVRRVIYASSIHAIGMHSRMENMGIEASHRPDTFYGLAKCFSEDLARMYWDKRQVESVCLRIFSCAQVTSARALGTWLSYRDLIHLVKQSISTPTVGFTIVYGISNNDRSPIDNSKAAFLGYRPVDNAEQFAEKILTQTPAEDLSNPEHLCLGGAFAAVELGQSGQAKMNIIDDTKKI